MRPDRIRLGILAVVTLFVCPCATLAQGTTSTDAAIAELRQLIVDQRAALDRQARLIEEQGRTLAALQQRVDGNSQVTGRAEPATPATTTAAAAVGAQVPAPQGPPGRTAAEPAPDLPAAASRPESSRVRSASQGRTRPSNWAVRPGWSPFTRCRPSGPTTSSSPPRSPLASHERARRHVRCTRPPRAA